jgi:hypothetical protein
MLIDRLETYRMSKDSRKEMERICAKKVSWNRTVPLGLIIWSPTSCSECIAYMLALEVNDLSKSAVPIQGGSWHCAEA